ncbi:MAG: chemotaxis protein CheB [Gammaproteobacteria bacterium]|jgi:chemosensory pili system protein ChpB (putative protein-glutamate methylesterase)
MAKPGERSGFRALLEREGVEVVLDRQLGTPAPESWNGAEVLLVDLNAQVVRRQIEGLLEKSPVPVLLNQGGLHSAARWSHALLAKLEALKSATNQQERERQGQTRPELRVVEGGGRRRATMLPVIVLCGSVGGPQAMARFLTALPAELPIAFLLIQHISEAYQNLLVEQLDRCGAWRVAMLGAEQNFEPGRVWVLPAESKVFVDPNGTVRRREQPWESVQRPDINAVLSGVAEAFGAGCGAIMFSGLGGDVAEGCARLVRRGGFVWTQSPESCVIGRLPEAAKRSGKVEFSGTPEQLARELASRYRSTTSPSLN